MLPRWRCCWPARLMPSNRSRRHRRPCRRARRHVPDHWYRCPTRSARRCRRSSPSRTARSGSRAEVAGGVEGDRRQGGRAGHRGAARPAPATRCRGAADHDRWGEGVPRHAQGIPPRNRDRVLVHVHGGDYVLAPGEAGTERGDRAGGFGGFKVIWSITACRRNSLSGRAGRRDGGVPRGAEDDAGEECGRYSAPPPAAA